MQWLRPTKARARGGRRRDLVLKIRIRDGAHEASVRCVKTGRPPVRIRSRVGVRFRMLALTTCHGTFLLELLVGPTAREILQ